MNILSDDFSLIFSVKQQSLDMRSLKIILLLAICAPITIVHCLDDDDDDFMARFFIYWLIPGIRQDDQATADSQPIEISPYHDYSPYLISSHVLAVDEDEKKTQDVHDVYHDILPSDKVYDQDQSSYKVDEFEEPATISKERLEQVPDFDSTEEILGPESSENSSSMESSESIKRRKFLNDEFERLFPWIMASSSSASSLEVHSSKEETTIKTEPIDDKKNKKEPREDKFNSKKYVEVNLKKPLQRKIRKRISLESENAESSLEDRESSLEDSVLNMEESNRRMKSSAEFSSEASNHEENSEEFSLYGRSHENAEDDSTPNIEESTHPKYNTFKSTASFENSDTSKSSTSYEGPVVVPLAPEYYDEIEFDEDEYYFTDQLASESPIIDSKSTENEGESISDISQVEEVESLKPNSEENIEENDEDKVTSMENKKGAVETESTMGDLSENIVSNNEMEKDNEIPRGVEDAKPMGRLSIAKFFRALCSAIPIV